MLTKEKPSSAGLVPEPPGQVAQEGADAEGARQACPQRPPPNLLWGTHPPRRARAKGQAPAGEADTKRSRKTATETGAERG